MAHAISDFIDTIKEKLTDAEYKEGMELLKVMFEATTPDKKLYKMTYLRPYTYQDDHCEDEECESYKYCLSFTKATSLVRLTDRGAESIRETNLFLGERSDMEAFIDVEVFRSFPDELECSAEWDEFPVLSLELVTE
jgi:hypothetical protein